MCTATGTVTGEEFVRTIAEIFSRNGGTEPYRYSLFDADGVKAVEVSEGDIHHVAALDIAASRTNPGLVCAIYARNTVAFGLARMWEMLVEASGWKTNVFRDRAEAVAWLKKEVESSFGMEIDLE